MRLLLMWVWSIALIASLVSAQFDLVNEHNASVELEHISGVLLNGSHTKNMPYYRVNSVSEGQVGVQCLNGGDATVQPQNELGYIVVSCGTK